MVKRLVMKLKLNFANGCSGTGFSLMDLSLLLPFFKFGEESTLLLSGALSPLLLCSMCFYNGPILSKFM